MLGKEGRPPTGRDELHNGTIYAGNPYRLTPSSTGQPHLWVENRVLPAGPTVDDIMQSGSPTPGYPGPG